MHVPRRFAGIIFLALLLVATWPDHVALWADSPATVTGTVVDPDGKPLPEARVVLSGEGVSPAGALSNAVGRFRFPAVNSHHVYSITADHTGFRSVTYDAMVLEAGRTRVVRFRLAHPGDRDIVALVTRDPFPYDEFLHGFASRFGAQVRVVDLDRERDPTEAVRRTRAEHPDLILGTGLRAARLIRREVGDIPSLLTLIADPRRYDLQTTTTCFLMGQPDADRLLDRLIAVLPGIRRIGMVYQADVSSLLARDLRQAAERRGLRLEFRLCHTPRELQPALNSLRGIIQALVVPDDDLTSTPRARDRITAWALKNRVPLAAPSPDWVDHGALFSYGASYERQGEEASRLAELILRGVLQPSDFRVLRSSEVQMAVNQQTAMTLGLSIPADLSFDQHD